MFHQVLKTGCRAEDARLRTTERLVKLIAVFCILAWRVFWTTMMGQAAQRTDLHLAITDRELALLDSRVLWRASTIARMASNSSASSGLR